MRSSTKNLASAFQYVRVNRRSTLEEVANGIPKDLRQGTRSNTAPEPSMEISVALFTGGFDRPYALGLALALASNRVRLDYIGSDDVDAPELHGDLMINFFNLKVEKRTNDGLTAKVARLLLYYARLIRYAKFAQPKVFHILWNNKIQFLDRTLLMFYYKLLGKKVVFTAHNVNSGRRDSNDSPFNRLTLRIQYRVVDHIFVHTEAMKSELRRDFGVSEQKVTVIPFGVNNSVPETKLTSADAKQRLGIGEGYKTILFFGNIGPYKGVEFLIAAFQRIAAKDTSYRLIVAGKPRGGCERYVSQIREAIDSSEIKEQVTLRIEFIPDEETELYFKGADLLVLPYREIYQSGVLFLGYNFGLPVVATDVGSLREDIIEGETGFLCRPCDPSDLAETIERYFKSDLFTSLATRRHEIREYAKSKYAWNHIGQLTRSIYSELHKPS